MTFVIPNFEAGWSTCDDGVTGKPGPDKHMINLFWVGDCLENETDLDGSEIG